MPIGIPAILGIIGAVTGGVELGTSLAGVGQPSQGDALKQQQQLLQQQQQKQAQQDALGRQKAVLANLANAQDQTGGAVSGGGLVNLASVIAGLPGAATDTTGQRALSQYLGTPSSDQGQNLVSQTFGLSGSQG